MNINLANLEWLHEQTMKNRRAVMDAGSCRCGHCLFHVNSSEVTEWADNGETAICPNCHVDSLIPEDDENPINNDHLNAFRNHYFLQTSQCVEA